MADTLSITDNRTGKTYEIPIKDGTIKALDLRQIKVDGDDFGLMTYDPAFMNTASCRSAITFDAECRQKQIYRLVAKMSTISAFGYRHMVGMPYAYPDNDLSYPGNFLNMMFKTTEVKYTPHPALEHAMDVLFILHADHEQNCSTNAMRAVGSSHVEPYSAVAAAAGALYGPLHGGANEAVLRMLAEIGSVDHVPEFIKKVKSGEGGRLMGFGHRVYKNYAPRARSL